MLNSKVDYQDTYWGGLIQEIDTLDILYLRGRVASVEGYIIKARYVAPSVGSECLVGTNKVLCEVIGVTNDVCILIAYEDTKDITINDEVVLLNNTEVEVCHTLLGRVINGIGKAIDGKGRIRCSSRYPLHASSPPILERPLITEQLITNVKVLDAFTPLGRGQRIGIFAGSGVGKSTLLGMIARHSTDTINVIALVGERSREVKELIEYEIGDEGMENTVVIVATSEESAAVRLRAVYYACAIAEYFRDRSYKVNLLVDSLTRVAHAQREIGMTRGEPPVARGYPTSLYRVLPQIAERCGTSMKGSITGIFTILVEGDEEDEPVSDIVRGIIDGHIILNRELAQQLQYPAVHIAMSLSRVANKVQNPSLFEAISVIRESISMYEQAKDIITAGVYTPGSNKRLDDFLAIKDELDIFLKQSIEESSDYSQLESFILNFASRLRGNVL